MPVLSFLAAQAKVGDIATTSLHERVRFKQLAKMMTNADLELAEQEKLLADAGRRTVRAEND